MQRVLRALTAVLTRTFLATLLFVNSASAQTAQDLVGTWAWVSVDVTGQDGVKRQPFGPTPKGFVMFDSNGRFGYLLTSPGRSKFASNNRDQGTPEENKATVQGSLAYTGTYSVTDKTLILSIEASTYPNAEGAQQKRTITLTGDEMKWENPVTTTGGTAVAVFKRVK